MAELWTKFRSLPWWGQLILWILVWPALAGLFVWNQWGDEHGWAKVAAVVLALLVTPAWWAGAAGGGAEDQPAEDVAAVDDGETDRGEVPSPTDTTPDEPEPDFEPTTEASPDEVVTEQPSATLGITPEEFQSRWNTHVAEFEAPDLRIDRLEVEDGDVQDVFQHQFDGFMFVQGSVRKENGLVRDLTVLGVPETDEQSLQLITAWGLLISSTSPDLTADQRGEVLNELGITGDADFTDHEAETVVGEVKYSVQFNDVVGLAMFAESAEPPSN